jgi:prepilin-type processing-associated H-X9-DG protein
MILPEMEQMPLFDSFGKFTGVNSAGVAATGFNAVMPSLPVPSPLQTNLPMYRSPSDSSSRITPPLLNGAWNVSGPPAPPLPLPNQGFGSSNYPGVVGSVLNASVIPTIANGVGNGAFSQNSKRRFTDFLDGQSSTFLVGERRSPSGTATAYSGGDTIWAGVGDEASIQGVVLAVGDCGWIGSGGFQGDGPNLVWTRAPSVSSPFPYSSFSSAHAGGVQFLFGDGHVQFINNSISSGPPNTPGSTYQNLAGVYEGMALGNY